jgi:hypothetical protein
MGLRPVGNNHGVYSLKRTYALENSVSRVALTRTNLLLEVRKVQRLRKALRSRSNSEAVRLVIDERLAVEAGLQALRNLRKLGGPADVFGRARAKRS